MKLEIFDPAKHIPTLHRWLDARGLDHSFTNSLPKIGFIGMDGKISIVAAFLRRVEPNFAMFDSLITNPAIEPRIRHTAIDYVSRHILNMCVPLGIAKVIAFTEDRHTKERGVKMGFKPLPAQLLVLDL